MWMERPVEFWEELGARYGDVCTVELGSIGTTVLFSHPDAVRQIFGLPTSSYECRPYNDYYKFVMGERSILLADGASHRRMRSLVLPSLQPRSFDRQLDDFQPLIDATCESWPRDVVFSPRLSLHLLSLRMILGIVFGSGLNPTAQKIADVFANEIYVDLGSLSAWTRFVHRKPLLREFIAAEAEARRATGSTERACLFDALIHGRDEAGNSLSHEEISDHIFTMLVAGVDTTAIALSWALYWIYDNPDVLGRLQRELGEGGRSSANLPFLNAVCLETLRMYPVVATPTGRKLLVDTEIQERQYAAGTTLLPCTHLVHRRADLFPEPDRFMPERFLDREYGSHEFFPFGGGARSCIGAVLAPVEMRIVLARIVESGRLTPAHTGPVKPVRHGTLIAPSESYQFIAREPQPAASTTTSEARA